MTRIQGGYDLGLRCMYVGFNHIGGNDVLALATRILFRLNTIRRFSVKPLDVHYLSTHSQGVVVVQEQHTQRVLGRGTPEEVREDAKRNIEALAPGGGFVFAAVHDIQANVPPENIMAMWEAWQEYGRYT